MARTKVELLDTAQAVAENGAMVDISRADPIPVAETGSPGAPGIHRNPRQRQEERQENKRDDLIKEFNAFRGTLPPTGNYKYLLYRTEPRAYLGKTTGTATGMLIDKYDAPLEDFEIQEKHGGELYHWLVRGKDPENMAKDRQWKFEIPRIDGPPKTVSTPAGAVPFDQAPYPGVRPDSGDAAAMGLVRDLMNNFMSKMDSVVQRQAPPGPDPALLKAQEDAREKDRQAHALQLKQMETNVELAKLEAEDRRSAEKLERETALAREKMQHETVLERMKQETAIATARLSAEAEARKAESDARKEETKAFIKVVEDTKKDSDSKMERLLDRMENNKQDFTQMLTQFRAIKDFLGDDDKVEPKETGVSVLKNMFPQFTEVVKYGIERLAPVQGAPQQTAPPQRQIAPGTVATSGPIAGTETAAAAPAAVPEINFEFPKPDASPQECVQLLAADIELGLRARWLGPDIYEKVVSKFPASVLGLLKNLPVEMCLDTIEKLAPGDAVIRSPRGKATVRAIHGLLKAAK